MWRGEYGQYAVEVPLNSHQSLNLSRHLKSKGHSVSCLTGFASIEAMPLRWGEVVPLWFIEGANKKESSGLLQLPFPPLD